MLDGTKLTIIISIINKTDYYSLVKNRFSPMSFCWGKPPCFFLVLHKRLQRFRNTLIQLLY